jgi:hypothetical protein
MAAILTGVGNQTFSINARRLSAAGPRRLSGPLPRSRDPLACATKGTAMLNQLTQTQKYAVYAFAAGVLTVILFLLLKR